MLGNVLLSAALAVTPTIAHGENAKDGAYPFSVLLTMQGLPTPDHGTRDSSCSGALIAPTWVITAGHCFRDASGRRVSRTVARETTAVVGRIKVKGPGGYAVRVVQVHQSETTDVALAELDHPITEVRPLRLATTPPTPGEALRLTGFGLQAGGAPATRLQTGKFVVDSVGDSLIETSGRAPRADTSPCPHDSGGPYFRTGSDGTPELVAVVSSGPTCPHEGADRAARVDNIADWITDTTTDRGHPLRTVALVVAAVAVLALGFSLWSSRTRSTGRPASRGSWSRSGTPVAASTTRGSGSRLPAPRSPSSYSVTRSD